MAIAYNNIASTHNFYKFPAVSEGYGWWPTITMAQQDSYSTYWCIVTSSPFIIIHKQNLEIFTAMYLVHAPKKVAYELGMLLALPNRYN